ncbi:MAG: L,D-transpeptidase [Candidatus Moranbacteria bacterium]|nr:L,D-transpeptidase [Candidatus Moranbacteria bacterium]
MRATILFFGLIAIFLSPLVSIADQEPEEIVIRRDLQMGGYYEHGKLVKSFPIMFGDDYGPLATPDGVYRVREKIIDYHSRKYDAPMPFSLFFTPARNAIHSRGPQFRMPALAIRRCCRTHGCITVDHDIAAWLYKRVPKSTRITIRGDRQK